MNDHDLDFTVRRDRLYQQVSDYIQQLIIDEALLPGDKLPSERELAERLNVSRTVIREAFRTLGVKGLVKVKSGKGMYVEEINSRSAVDSISLLLKTKGVTNSFRDLSEVRLALEVDMAGLAAERATEEEIEEMAEFVRLMEDHAKEPELFIRYDLAFHSTIARATHNELFAVLQEPITDLLVDFRMTTYQHNVQSAVKGGLMHHSNILQRIKARDPEGARHAMREHLKQGIKLMAEAQAANAGSDRNTNASEDGESK